MGKRAGIAVAGFAIVLALLSIACGDSRQGPSGLFRLAGVITESGLPTVPVTQALVGVSGTSVATTTSADGTFALDGLPADVEIQISKDQFEPSVMSVHLDGPREIRVQLRRTGAPPNYAGTYTMTIGDGNCPSLPSGLGQRTYTATLSVDWPFVEATLSGADFAVGTNYGYPRDETVRGNRLPGGYIHDPIMRFPRLNQLGTPYDDFGTPYPDIVERLANGMFLVISGRVEATLSATGAVGTLAGMFELFDRRFATPMEGDWPVPIASCPRSHPFRLSR